MDWLTTQLLADQRRETPAQVEAREGRDRAHRRIDAIIEGQFDGGGRG